MLISIFFLRVMAAYHFSFPNIQSCAEGEEMGGFGGNTKRKYVFAFGADAATSATADMSEYAASVLD